MFSLDQVASTQIQRVILALRTVADDTAELVVHRTENDGGTDQRIQDELNHCVLTLHNLGHRLDRVVNDLRGERPPQERVSRSQPSDGSGERAIPR